MPSARPSLHIAGGTYGESCAFPRYSEVYGSGLRAASALAASGVDVVFHTVAEDFSRKHIDIKAATYGFETRVAARPETIWFSYLHSLSGGLMAPRPSAAAGLMVEADFVLRFGMVDATVLVAGRRVVYDPQSPREPRPFHEGGSSAGELAVVLNRREAARLGGSEDIRENASRIASSEHAEVVVIKDGPRGALVCTSRSATWIPVHATPRTFLIGSGDIFSAVFAKEWACDGTDPVEAAVRASVATASWCSASVLPLVMDPAGFECVRMDGLLDAPRPNVYLAGPFFDVPSLWWVTHARDILVELGLDVFSPYHEIGFAGKGNVDVAAKDLAAMEECDVVFALLDGFDPGTLFEVGHARSKGIPVVCLQTAGRSGTHETMLLGTGCTIHDDLGSAAYDLFWLSGRKLKR